MANIFDGWKPPAPATDQSSASTSTTADAPPTQMPAAMTYDQPGGGPLSWLHNLAVAGNLSTRAADDYLTRGYGDVLQSKVTGQPVDELRAQTTAAHQAMGALDPVIGAGTAMVGGVGNAPAMAADAARAATGGSRLAGWGAGALAAGGQSAADAALGTLGHGGSGSDALSSAEWGGGIGTLLGMLGVGTAKGAGPAKPIATPPSTADLEAIKNNAYNVAGRIQYDQPTIQAAVNQARGNIAGGAPRVTEAGQGAISQLNALDAEARQYGGASAERVGDYLNNLHMSKTGDAVPVAGQTAQSSLQNMLDTAKPSSPHWAGSGGAAMAKADAANANFQNSALIDEMRRKAALPQSGGIGTTAPSMANTELSTRPNFYQNPDVNAAMRDIGGGGSSVPSSWVLKHAIGFPVLGALAGGIHGGSTAGEGENPWARAGKEALEYGGASMIVPTGANWLRNRLTNMAIKRALPALTQGAPYAPQGTGNLLRAVLSSQGAKGTGY